MVDNKLISLRVFIAFKAVSTQGADMESLSHACARPTLTGAYDRTGKGDVFLPHDHRILLDAVIRASEKMGWPYDIVDVSKYGWLKKYRSKEPVPRIEYNEHVLEGIPTSDDIIEFVLQHTSEKNIALKK